MDFAEYVPVEVWEGVNIFQDAFQCNVTDLSESVRYVAQLLVEHERLLAALPLCALLEFCATHALRDTAAAAAARLLRAHALVRTPRLQRWGEVANRYVSGFGWEMSSRCRFATPADFPLQHCSPYSHAHVRRERLGCVYRSRAVFCRPLPNLSVTIRSFFIAVSQPTRAIRNTQITGRWRRGRQVELGNLAAAQRVLVDVLQGRRLPGLNAANTRAALVPEDVVPAPDVPFFRQVCAADLTCGVKEAHWTAFHLLSAHRVRGEGPRRMALANNSLGCMRWSPKERVASPVTRADVRRVGRVRGLLCGAERRGGCWCWWCVRV